MILQIIASTSAVRCRSFDPHQNIHQREGMSHTAFKYVITSSTAELQSKHDRGTFNPQLRMRNSSRLLLSEKHSKFILAFSNIENQCVVNEHAYVLYIVIYEGFHVVIVTIAYGVYVE